ncbi:MAG: hypothetical protein OXH99_07875 [Bryobacterales bacterium]|nr:hypothetical protein [Bryobacterales bacterium]
MSVNVDVKKHVAILKSMKEQGWVFVQNDEFTKTIGEFNVSIRRHGIDWMLRIPTLPPRKCLTLATAFQAAQEFEKALED